MRTFETRVGGKAIYGIEELPGTVTVRSDCKFYDKVQFKVTTHQAEELFVNHRTKVIQQIVPDLHPALRELFVTGMSPAEWDDCLMGEVKPVDSYPGYQYAESS